MDDDFTPPEHLPVIAAAFEGGMVVVAVALGRLLSQPPLATFRWTWLDCLWGALATVPPLTVLWVCLRWRLRLLGGIVRVIDQIIVPLFSGCRTLECAVIALLAGVGEEMLFRGVIQAAVTEWIGGPWGVWVGLVAAAVLFALGHCISLSYVVLVGLIGIYLGGIWLATDNLLVPMLAHGGYDFLALLYLTKIRGKQAPAETQ